MSGPYVELKFANDCVMNDAFVRATLFVRTGPKGLLPGNELRIRFTQRQKTTEYYYFFLRYAWLTTKGYGVLKFQEPLHPGDHEFPIVFSFPSLSSTVSSFFSALRGSSTKVSVKLFSNNQKNPKFKNTKSIRVIGNTHRSASLSSLGISNADINQSKGICCFSREKNSIKFSLSLNKNLFQVGEFFEARVSLVNLTDEIQQGFKLGFLPIHGYLDGTSYGSAIDAVNLPKLEPNQKYSETFQFKFPGNTNPLIYGSIFNHHLRFGLIYKESFCSTGFEGIPVYQEIALPDSGSMIKTSMKNWNPIRRHQETNCTIQMYKL
jgi:hypothetical protein